MKLKDYTGNIVFSGDDCPACSYAKHKFSLPCGMAYENEFFTVSQDWELPINGMIIIAPKKHINYFSELDSSERAKLFELANQVMQILKAYKVASEFNMLFEEKQDTHFHIWILPRNPFVKAGLNPTKEIGRCFDYAKTHFNNNLNYNEIQKTQQILKNELNNK